MNRIAPIALLALATLASTTNRASAQTQVIAQSNVPFAFSVNGAVLPAGNYIVSSLSPSLLHISNTRHPNSAAFVLTREANRTKSDGQVKMVFERYGDQYFLHEVISPITATDSVVPPSKQEKKAGAELAKANRGQPVLVAVK